jgi:membrane associated rhomboid family serine protease
MTPALITLIGGSAADARVPMLGASGAIVAVLGAYIVPARASRRLS